MVMIMKTASQLLAHSLALQPLHLKAFDDANAVLSHTQTGTESNQRHGNFCSPLPAPHSHALARTLLPLHLDRLPRVQAL